MRSTAIWSFLGLVVLGAGGLLSGCDSDDELAKSALGESCARTSDCVDGLKCLEGACYKSSAPSGDGGDGGDDSVGPTPPVLSGEGETCTKKADCETSLSCFSGRCVSEGDGEGGAGPVGPALGGLGETCTVTSDCQASLACVPATGANSVGVCTPVQTGIMATGNDCHAECKEAADCCELPIAYHQPYDIAFYPYGTGTNSCTELKAALTGVTCSASGLLPAVLAQCLAYDSFCECADDAWSCNDSGMCIYGTECTVDGAQPGGCPALTRSGRALTTTCSTDGACSPVAAAACTNDASCTNKAVADGALAETCVAGECTCYKKQGCYRKCAKDLDCAKGKVCDTDAAVCIPAPQCETDSQCAALNMDYRFKCDEDTKTCIKPCETDLDCNPLGVTGSLAQVCNADKMCEAIGCTNDNDCAAPGGGGVKNFCTPKLPPAMGGTAVSSAITDGQAP